MAKRKTEEGAQFVRYFGPVLDALRKLGGSGKPDEVTEQIVSDMSLTDDIQNELLPSGESRFRNQVAWARFYLVREGLIDSSKRGVWSLTERGRATSLTPVQSREVFLRWVKIFQDQRKAKAAEEEPIAEQVAEATGAPSKDYRAETIDLLLGLPPAGFERLSQRLLREAGFIQVVVKAKAATEASTVTEHCKSIRLSLSRCCFSASVTPSRCPPRTFGTFEGQWQAAPTRASLSPPERLRRKQSARRLAMECRQSSLLMEKSSLICLRISSLAFAQ